MLENNLEEIYFKIEKHIKESKKKENPYIYLNINQEFTKGNSLEPKEVENLINKMYKEYKLIPMSVCRKEENEYDLVFFLRY